MSGNGASNMQLVVAVLRRPHLWITAVKQWRILTPKGWWKRRPFLPVPDARYMRFRMITAYGGDGSAQPTIEDFITFLEWCKAWPSISRIQVDR